MTMLLTLKKVQNGLFTFQVKKPSGESEIKMLEPEKFYDYIQACEFYCEANSIDFRFIIPNHIRKICQNMIMKLANRE